ncbi:dihydroorotase [Bryobacter aggregatus]|uniref:dihydroorotase n=1 Tax=Bryobacter aggregatus TaxID=360054 RepID=UPI0004E1DC07|nr:dihydroorotase [Bryobacter aggregatus]
MAKLLIRNGRVIDPANRIDRVADVLLANGIVRGVGENLPSRGAEEFDATGLIVAPGFIDMHVHLREPGFESSETIESGSKAAAAGGFTSVCCMPNTSPVNDTAHLTRYIIERAKQVAKVNVFPIGAITKGSAGEELASIGAMQAAGTVAISDDGRPVMNSRVMRRAMEIAASFDIPVIDHCEDLNLSAGGDMHEGLASLRYGLRGIPACSEDVMVARDILLAEVTGARFHVAHLSTTNAIAMVAEAKRRGLRVTCEVTPHHFAIHDLEITPYDSNYKMKPPIRCSHDVAAMIEGIKAGYIDAIATDHAPHSVTDKMQEFERCPFGILGLETAIGLSLECLVHPGHITIERMIELFTTGPAGILKLNRGALTPGLPADVTLLDLESKWTYDVNKSASKSRNSPFDGKVFRGRAVGTIVSGELIWQA